MSTSPSCFQGGSGHSWLRQDELQFSAVSFREGVLVSRLKVELLRKLILNVF
jgi:hypothetical protein